MNDMFYWSINPETKEVLQPRIKAEFRGGVHHIPQDALRIEPVKPKEGFAVIATFSEDGLPNGSKLIEDHRGEVIYNKANCTESEVVVELGAIKKGWTLDKPATKFDEWVSGKWVTNLANKYIHDFNQTDATRSNLYAQYCDPLMNEARIKRLQGKNTEADSLETQAIAARKKIETENPWPVNPT